VIWNSLNVFVVSVGIPVVPPTSTVNISPLENPNPGSLSSKLITLDPCPTVISILAP